MSIIKKVIDRAKSKKHPYPIYYQRRNCRLCGATFSCDTASFHHEYDKNGERFLKYIVLSCVNHCELHNGETIIWLNWYVDEDTAVAMIDNWFKDSCPVLEAGLP